MVGEACMAMTRAFYRSVRAAADVHGSLFGRSRERNNLIEYRGNAHAESPFTAEFIGGGNFFSRRRGFAGKVSTIHTQPAPFFFLFFRIVGDQLACTIFTLKTGISPQWLNELRRLWPSVPVPVSSALVSLLGSVAHCALTSISHLVRYMPLDDLERLRR